MASSAGLHTGYVGELQKLEASFARCLTLIQDNKLPRAEFDLIVEALFLQAAIHFEIRMEEMFWGLVTGQMTHPLGLRPNCKISDEALARAVFLRGGYITWFPIEEAVKFTQYFFADGMNPFAQIVERTKGDLKTCGVIRNYIAHKGPAALEKFEASVTKLNSLPKGMQTVAGYLQQPVGNAGKRRRMNFHLEAYSSASATLFAGTGTGVPVPVPPPPVLAARA